MASAMRISILVGSVLSTSPEGAGREGEGEGKGVEEDAAEGSVWLYQQHKQKTHPLEVWLAPGGVAHLAHRGGHSALTVPSVGHQWPGTSAPAA